MRSCFTQVYPDSHSYQHGDSSCVINVPSGLPFALPLMSVLPVATDALHVVLMFVALAVHLSSGILCHHAI